MQPVASGTVAMLDLLACPRAQASTPATATATTGLRRTEQAVPNACCRGRTLAARGSPAVGSGGMEPGNREHGSSPQVTDAGGWKGNVSRAASPHGSQTCNLQLEYCSQVSSGLTPDPKRASPLFLTAFSLWVIHAAPLAAPSPLTMRNCLFNYTV